MSTGGATATVDEAALDTTQNGNDLVAGNVTGSNSTSTNETVTGQLAALGAVGAVTYTLDAGQTANYGQIQINSDGSWIYTLTDAVDGDSLTPSQGGNNGTNTINGAESFTYTATDANGNTVQGTININVTDDVPTAVTPIAVTLTNTSGGTGTAYLDTDHNVINNYGADGAGAVIFTAESITSLENQGLTSGFTPLEYSISQDGTELIASKATDHSTVFTIDIQPSGSENQYVVTMSQAVDATGTIDFNATNSGYSFVGGNTAWAGFVGTTENSPDLLMTPAINGYDNGTINASAISGGVGSGNSVGLDNNGYAETFRVDFVTDLSGNPAGSGGYSDTANQDFTFSGHYVTNGATAEFTATSGSVVNIAAFDDFDGNNTVGDGTLDTITGIAFSYNGVSSEVIIPTTTTQEVTIGEHTYTVTLNSDGTVDVGGLYGTSGSNAVGTYVAVYTDTAGTLDAHPGYSSLEFTYVSGDSFKIGDFGATTITSDPVDFTVPVSIEDGDGDITSSGSLDITLDPSASSSLSNLAASSLLAAQSTESSHSIYSTSADDILTASTGIDTFIWQAGQTGTDHVSGFNLTQDTLNISDLLTQWNGNSNTLDHYLDITVTNGDTVISIDADANGSVDQTIVLDGTDVSSYGNSSSEIIQGLVDSGNGPLIVDSSSTDTATTTYSTTDALNHTEQVVKEV